MRANTLPRRTRFNSLIVVLISVWLGLGHAPARADVAVGSGFSSVTSGRAVPLLSAAWLSSDWAVSASATGVATPLYYHNAWTLLGVRSWSAGTLGWGSLDAGLGAGLFYARRGYRPSPAAGIDTADDFNFGPAFRVSWRVAGPVFIAAEAMFGLRRPLQLLVLSAQDTAQVTAGVVF